MVSLSVNLKQILILLISSTIISIKEHFVHFFISEGCLFATGEVTGTDHWGYFLIQFYSTCEDTPKRFVIFTSGSLLTDCYLAGTSEHCALYSRGGPVAGPPPSQSSISWWLQTRRGRGIGGNAGPPVQWSAALAPWALSKLAQLQRFQCASACVLRVGRKNKNNNDQEWNITKRTWIKKTLGDGWTVDAASRQRCEDKSEKWRLPVRLKISQTCASGFQDFKKNPVRRSKLWLDERTPRQRRDWQSQTFSLWLSFFKWPTVK